MQLLALGLNYTTAPIAIRERIAFTAEEIGQTIPLILKRYADSEFGSIREVAILSTCNRTELYCACENAMRAKEVLLDYLSEAKQLSLESFAPHMYSFFNEEAARHAFRVASGLNSMVLGETQIVGQIKKAEKQAIEAHGLSVYLHHLFQSTFTVAKEVRTATAIGANSVSLAAAAVRLATRLFGKLHNEHVLFVGAGEMIELCAAHFAAHSPKSITIANRTIERGQTLARTVQAQAIRLADLPATIANYDIIVSCTAASLPIIGLGMIERAINERRHRPMFIVDLAVPRDVEPEIEKLEDVYVYTVDDLGKVVNEGRQSRQNAIVAAEQIIDERVKDFAKWLSLRGSVPSIQTLRERAQQIKEQELSRSLKFLKKGQNPEQVLEQLANALMNKFIHAPTVALKQAKDLPEQERIVLEQALAMFYKSNDRH